MTLDPLLIDVLACPEDKGPLLYFADEDVLFNPRLHRTYPVRDGIPVMLIDEATTVDAAEDARLTAKAEAGGAVTDGHSRRDVTPSPLPADSRDLWEATLGLPEQVVAAADAAREIDGLPGHDEVENVVVLGMGTAASWATC